MEQNGNVILSVRDLNVKFTLRGKTLHAIRGVSLDLYEGETLAVVGESGSGKSVLNKTFMGLLDKNGYIDSGSILFEGQDLTKLKTEKEWERIRGGRIAMVMQDPMTCLNPLKTIGWQIAESIRYHQGLKGSEAKAKAIQMLRDVGITDPERRYRQYPHEFSGGMRQRVAIAIAVACNPKILICDEPTTALDVTIQAQIIRLISDHAEEVQPDGHLHYPRLGRGGQGGGSRGGDVRGRHRGDRHLPGGLLRPEAPLHMGAAGLHAAAGCAGREAQLHPRHAAQPVPAAEGRRLAPRNPYALKIDFEYRPPYFEVTPTHKAKTWLLSDRAPKIDPPEAIRNIKNLVPLGGDLHDL